MSIEDPNAPAPPDQPDFDPAEMLRQIQAVQREQKEVNGVLSQAVDGVLGMYDTTLVASEVLAQSVRVFRSLAAANLLSPSEIAHVYGHAMVDAMTVDPSEPKPKVTRYRSSTRTDKPS